MNWSDCQSRDDIPLVLNEKGLKGVGVEIGVAEGYYSDTILRQWEGEKLYLVDIWKFQPSGYYDGANLQDAGHDKNLDICRVLMSKYVGRYEFLREFSTKAASHFPDNFFDFVYVDANHSYDAVMADLRVWYPKVKSGGVFAGHDYVDPPNRTFGTKPAVDEFFQRRPEKVVIIQTPPGGNQSWLVEKV